MKILREPLLHFAVGGAILFAGFVWLNREQAATGPEPVRINEGDLRWLKETWANQWMREPSPQELQGLVADLVSEELLAREAVEMGLDEDDTIVRRRLAQKLQFLVEDTSRFVEPTEEELRLFQATNAARFQTIARVSFSQIYFSPEYRKDPSSDAKEALVELQAGGDNVAATIGDRLLVDGDFRDVDEQTVSSMFGPEFARAVFAFEPGVWSGPVKSGYGVHLVRMADLTAATQRPFEQVRDEVLKEWRVEKATTTNRDYLARLRQKYGVVFDDGVKGLLGTDPVADVAAR